MVVAGQTPESETLQASLGYARTFYNCVTMMPTMALCNYFQTVVPGAIGANRHDRLPRYFWRSVLLTSLCILPSIATQWFAEPILIALGVPRINAQGVGVYCHLMVATAWLSLLDNHLESLFVNLMFVKTATANALLTGLGVDMVFTYLFIYKYNMGMRGAAWVQVLVRSVRVVLWLLMMVCSRLTHTMLIIRKGSGRADPLLTLSELRIYFGQNVPQYLAMLAGWLIFELQLVLLTNVKGVTASQLAAGAIWINCEGTMAAIQMGWIRVCGIRCLKLLGKRDPGASKAFAIMLLLSFLLVACLNIPLIVQPGADALSRLMSNDNGVRLVFSRLVWVLAVHAQTRIVDLTCASVFVPIGLAKTRVGVAACSFWLIAAPITVVGALTDAFTTSSMIKVQLCMACTSIGQFFNGLTYGLLLLRTDWDKAARTIEARANTDAAGPGAADDAPGESARPTISEEGSIEPIVCASVQE